MYIFALLLLFSYLCVVVKEHADLQSPEPFKPRPYRFGKSFCISSAGHPAALRLWPACADRASPRARLVGVTGFEPVTLRLSSACSNQLSYTPIKPNLACRTVARAKAGGAEGIRTPDLQLAKLPLYQLSYSPTFIYDLRFRICGLSGANCNPQISLSSASPFHFHLINQRAEAL